MRITPRDTGWDGGCYCAIAVRHYFGTDHSDITTDRGLSESPYSETPGAGPIPTTHAVRAKGSSENLRERPKGFVVRMVENTRRGTHGPGCLIGRCHRGPPNRPLQPIKSDLERWPDRLPMGSRRLALIQYESDGEIPENADPPVAAAAGGSGHSVAPDTAVDT